MCHLQGDPTYLIVDQDGKLENFGVNAVCTHLGCVVPWVGVSSDDSTACACMHLWCLRFVLQAGE